MREFDLRDLLAANLEILEPKLRLVDTEVRFPLEGRKYGQMDILARDRDDNIVIIEVKRSDEVAKSAAHQVFKYTEILRGRGCPPEKIRVMIASTEWTELGRSYSGYAKLTPFDLRGYHLQLDEAGERLRSANRVELKGPARSVKPSDVHMMFMFDTPSQRNQGWLELQERARGFGAEHLIAFDFSTRIKDRTWGRFLLYLVIGSIDPDDPRTEEIPTKDADDETDYRDREHFLQTWLTGRLYSGIAEFGRVQLGHPEKFRQIVFHKTEWLHEGMIRHSGSFLEQSEIWDYHYWVSQISEKSGFNQTSFVDGGTPSQANAWKSLRERTLLALGTNPDWHDLVDKALQRIEDTHPDARVDIDLYNPTDFVGFLLSAWPDRVEQLEPQLLIQVTDLEDGSTHSIRGHLVHAEPNIKTRFIDRFQEIYRGPESWASAKMLDKVAATDLALLEVLDLKYVLFESTEQWKVMHVIDEEEPRVRVAPHIPDLRLQSHLLGAASLSQFLHDRRSEVDSLMTEYRLRLGIERP